MEVNLMTHGSSETAQPSIITPTNASAGGKTDEEEEEGEKKEEEEKEDKRLSKKKKKTESAKTERWFRANA